MRIVAAIFVTFFIRCVYLYPSDLFSFNDISINNVFNDSCIFGPKYMSIILYNSVNLEGEDIGAQESCNFDPLKPIVFLVHGFISYANTTSGYNLAKRFVQQGYTVFSLDWSEAACRNGIPILRLMEYPQAVQNTREIGQLMAEYVESLVKKCNILLDNITFIGHSLGAHVSAFAAKHIQSLGLGKIPRLIGLDPADPLFGLNRCINRLCKSDATHVIIFHTSTLGISKPIGHLDLQFNGGLMQPGCGLGDLNVVCSHSRAFEYPITLSDCAYPGLSMKPSFLDIFMSRPVYPAPNTTDCILLTKEIFTIKPSEKLREGNYYVFVDPVFPYCTRKSFSCSLI
ncbi:phospholipase A1-like [Nylanderia fulva]|uniref:phospholipase A1-like n=1 Tax=Nylanderia fulva TaxID=613905 RepID=UPI0010FB26B1|nr:phospholipase A1-like [Nylanderia fulva]